MGHEKASLKNVFLAVGNHLIAQGRPAMLDGECRYRAYGLSCAVGCLIEDEHYSEDFEGDGVDSERVVDALKRSGVDFSDGDMVHMLSVLQDTHDGSDPFTWIVELFDIGHSYGLVDKHWEFII